MIEHVAEGPSLQERRLVAAHLFRAAMAARRWSLSEDMRTREVGDPETSPATGLMVDPGFVIDSVRVVADIEVRIPPPSGDWASEESTARAMAQAVLAGDWTAALALADWLTERVTAIHPGEVTR